MIYEFAMVWRRLLPRHQRLCPKQVSALLCLPESGVNTPLIGDGDFSTGTTGIFAAGAHTLTADQWRITFG